MVEFGTFQEVFRHEVVIENKPVGHYAIMGLLNSLPVC
jgi:hypothetical protein